MERVRGIEPPAHPWQGRIVPLNYTRMVFEAMKRPSMRPLGMYQGTRTMDIETALIHYINNGILAGKSRSTLQGNQSSLNHFIKYLKNAFVGLNLESLSGEVIEGYLTQGLKIKGWKKYTYWTKYKDLNTFFNWCLKKGYVNKSPLAEIPKPRQPQQLPKSLKEKEAVLLLKIVSAIPYRYHFLKVRNKAIVATLLFTGLRKSELINLRYSDVDLENNFISVEHGKGDKRREVPIQQEVLKPILYEYIEYRSKLLKTSERFCSRDKRPL